MRLLVTGKEGQVVSSLLRQVESTGHEVIALGRPELDLASDTDWTTLFAHYKPDCIISAAAYTAVDKAESEPDIAYAINGHAPGLIGKAADALNIPVLHLSTDYVFAGDKSGVYFEDDPTGPVSVYGKSKLRGEGSLAAATANHVILRTAWVYSPFGANFLKTMLRVGETRSELGVVADQFGAPTSAIDIADALIKIAELVVHDPSPSLRGTFHLTGSGETSWADFATEIFKVAERYGRLPVTVKPITTADYPTPAKRPANSRLSGAKLKATFDIQLPDWQSSTAKVVQELLGE